MVTRLHPSSPWLYCCSFLELLHYIVHSLVSLPRTWGHIYKMVSVPLISAVRVCFNTTQNQNLNTEKAIFTKLPFNYNISFVVKRHIFWIIHCVSLCSNGVSKINYMDTYRMKYQMKRRVLAPHPSPMPPRPLSKWPHIAAARGTYIVELETTVREDFTVTAEKRRPI